MDTKCCDDGRWHLVRGDTQLEVQGPPYWDPIESQLSPPCGGTALPSSHALHLDGASYLDLPVNVEEPIFELWFRTSEARGPLLASTSTSHRLYLSGGKLCFSPAENGSAFCTTASNFADGAWHHAAFTAYGGLYADGTLRIAGRAQNVSAWITGVHAGYGPVDDASVSQYFVGDLDEIRIWRAERHSFDILDFHATRLTNERMLSDMQGYFPLEESGSAATTKNLALDVALDVSYDCSGNEQGGAGGAGPERPDATLVGFSSVTSPWVEPGAF
jgi:hypothetical protein